MNCTTNVSFFNILQEKTVLSKYKKLNEFEKNNKIKRNVSQIQDLVGKGVARETILNNVEQDKVLDNIADQLEFIDDNSMDSPKKESFIRAEIKDISQNDNTKSLTDINIIKNNNLVEISQNCISSKFECEKFSDGNSNNQFLNNNSVNLDDFIKKSFDTNNTHIISVKNQDIDKNSKKFQENQKFEHEKINIEFSQEKINKYEEKLNVFESKNLISRDTTHRSKDENKSIIIPNNFNKSNKANKENTRDSFLFEKKPSINKEIKTNLSESLKNSKNEKLLTSESIEFLSKKDSLSIPKNISIHEAEKFNLTTQSATALSKIEEENSKNISVSLQNNPLQKNTTKPIIKYDNTRYSTKGSCNYYEYTYKPSARSMLESKENSLNSRKKLLQTKGTGTLEKVVNNFNFNNLIDHHNQIKKGNSVGSELISLKDGNSRDSTRILNDAKNNTKKKNDLSLGINDTYSLKIKDSFTKIKMKDPIETQPNKVIKKISTNTKKYRVNENLNSHLRNISNNH